VSAQGFSQSFESTGTFKLAMQRPSLSLEEAWLEDLSAQHAVLAPFFIRMATTQPSAKASLDGVDGVATALGSPTSTSTAVPCVSLKEIWQT
jgi:hypothetical protein